MTEDKLSIRLATEDDYGEIMIFSKGLYGGGDYLPTTYHNWLNNSNFITIVGIFEEKVIGYVALHIVDDGKTAVHKALRIDSNYRSRGFGGQLTDQANEYACDKYPSIIRARSTSAGGHYGVASQKLNIKDGKKVILEKVFVRRLVTMNDQLIDTMKTSKTSNVFKCSREDGANILLNTKCDLFPNNIHMAAWQAYDIVESNIDQMFGEKDRLLFTLSTNESNEEKEIESFSHVRYSDGNESRFDMVLYANEITLIQDHILYLLRDVLDEGNDKITISICCSEEMKYKVEFVLSNELGLVDDSVGKEYPPGYILYEKAL